MTQLNTPYPSTAYLTGFLRSRGVDAVQEDLALALILALLSSKGLLAVREEIAARPAAKHTPRVTDFVAQFERYLSTLPGVIAFLQDRDPTLAHRIASRAFLPEGARFASLDAYIDAEGDDQGDGLAWAFGALGVHDRARHLATLYLNDIADVLRDAIDPRFEFVRYGESLARNSVLTQPPPSAVTMDGWCDLTACAMRKAAYTVPGNGTDTSTSVGRWRCSAARVSSASVRSIRFGGAASASASGSKLGWLCARRSA